jgi:hypothetical protein
MSIDEAIKYFGNLNQVLRKLGLTPSNMTRWKRQGYIPLLQQYRIAELTDGALMPDEEDPKYLKLTRSTNAT